MARFAVGLSLVPLSLNASFLQQLTAFVARRVGLPIALLWLIGTGLAQIDPSGIRPFSTQVPDPVSSVDLATSNVVVQIRIRTKLGKIPFNYSLVANSSPNGQKASTWTPARGCFD